MFSSTLKRSTCRNLGGALREKFSSLSPSFTEPASSNVDCDDERRPGQCLLVDFPSNRTRRHVRVDSEDENSISTMTVSADGKTFIQNETIARFVHAFGLRIAGKELTKAQGDAKSFRQESRPHHHRTTAQNFPTFVVFEKTRRRSPAIEENGHDNDPPI